MKYLKMLSLAAIAAAALTALVGVGSASAVTLCENNQATGCTSHVNSGATIDFSQHAASGSTPTIKLAGPLGIVLDTCTISTVKGPTSNTGADDTTTAVTGTITTLTFEGCTRKTTVIQTGTLETPGGAKDPSYGTLSITASGTAGNGAVSSSNSTVVIHELPEFFGNPETCAYKTSNTPLGTLTASATAGTFDINATITAETENCPNGTWSGNYISTGPTVVKAIAH